jgi:hypothetical protein
LVSIQKGFLLQKNNSNSKKILNTTTKDMKTNNRISRAVHFLRNWSTKKSPIKFTVDDLVHPRFGINDTEVKNLNKTPNPLQFLMYSKENDTLFI